MGSALGSEVVGTLEFLVFNCLQAAQEDYNESFHNDEKMKEDIEALYKMGQAAVGTDEKGTFKILCAAPPEYMKKLNMAYADKHGVTLLHSLSTEFKGIAKDAAQFLIGMKIKPYEEIAKLLERASAGVGTNETLLSTALIRYQGVMKDVMLAHVELFGKTIVDRVRAESRGVYEALFLELLAAVEN